MESYFMGIDTGTNSSKGVLINSHGEIIAEYTTEHAMTNPAPGHYEHDADKDWWGDFCIISNALIKNANISPSDIKAVGASALGADCAVHFAKQFYTELMHVQPMKWNSSHKCMVKNRFETGMVVHSVPAM